MVRSRTHCEIFKPVKGAFENLGPLRACQENASAIRKISWPMYGQTKKLGPIRDYWAIFGPLRYSGPLVVQLKVRLGPLRNFRPVLRVRKYWFLPIMWPITSRTNMQVFARLI